MSYIMSVIKLKNQNVLLFKNEDVVRFLEATSFKNTKGQCDHANESRQNRIIKT